MTTYDAIVIGTGQAGPHVARRFVAAGMRVAIVERKLFGGTCVNTGCIPTKAMVASAYAARLAQRAGDYGVDHCRRRQHRHGAREGAEGRHLRAVEDGLEKSLRTLDGCTVYDGHARFESATEISVGYERLTAGRIFINVGGRARPADAGDRRRPVSHQQLDDGRGLPPQHLVIVGGSYIGLEFGQMFRRFGSEVTIVEMGPRLIQREDPDVSDAIREILEAEGIHIRLDAKCISLSTHGPRRRRHRPSASTGPRHRRVARAARGRPPSQHRRPRARQGRRLD